jgi:hypothetical protein
MEEELKLQSDVPKETIKPEETKDEIFVTPSLLLAADMQIQSISDIQPIAEPNAAKKYKSFLELLFGTISRDISSLQIQAVQKQIRFDIGSRTNVLSSNRIPITGNLTSSAQLVEKYREEHDHVQ